MADSINYQLAKFVASYGKVSQIPESTCPEVSFVGRSNVGKSSIMNKLFGRKSLVKVLHQFNHLICSTFLKCPPRNELAVTHVCFLYHIT